jgi:hypothetical protein
MKVLSHTFQKTRLLVALALLFSAAAPLVQYACGVTGETTTRSARVVETEHADAPCGVVSDGVHDRLCGESGSSSGCEGEACTTETVNVSSVARADLPQARDALSVSSDLFSVEQDGHALRRLSSSSLTSERDRTARAPDPVPVRLRTLSFLL